MRGRKKGSTKPQCKPKIYNSFYSAYKVDEEGNETLYATGTVKDICSALDLTKSGVCKAVQMGSLIRRRYRIYYDGQD